MSDQQHNTPELERRLVQRRSGLDRRQDERRHVDVPVDTDRRGGADRRQDQRRSGDDRRSA